MKRARSDESDENCPPVEITPFGSEDEAEPTYSEVPAILTNIFTETSKSIDMDETNRIINQDTGPKQQDKLVDPRIKRIKTNSSK